MKEFSYREAFIGWIKARIVCIVPVLILEAVIAIVALLYHADAEPYLYSLLVFSFIMVCIGVADCRRYISHYRTLLLIYDELDEISEVSIPSSVFVSPECAEIIEKIGSIRNEISFEMKKREDDARDYYTLWTHQVKTPIAAMRLLLESDNSENAELLKNELFRIERYLEMALNYIRLENMTDDLVLREYRIYDIVGGALKKYAPLFIRSGLSLEFEEFPLTAVTDEKWLAFVIEQILSNSIKYTHKGGVRIFAEDNILVISDDGIGISEEDLPRLFSRGFTGYNGRMDKKSTGLGLYLCKKITEKLGHKISVESQVGKGTEIRIDFTQETNVT